MGAYRVEAYRWALAQFRENEWSETTFMSSSSSPFFFVIFLEVEFQTKLVGGTWPDLQDL